MQTHTQKFKLQEADIVVEYVGTLYEERLNFTAFESHFAPPVQTFS